jgi:hypothetical protein
MALITRPKLHATSGLIGQIVQDHEARYIIGDAKVTFNSTRMYLATERAGKQRVASK